MINPLSGFIYIGPFQLNVGIDTQISVPTIMEFPLPGVLKGDLVTVNTVTGNTDNVASIVPRVVSDGIVTITVTPTITITMSVPAYNQVDFSAIPFWNCIVFRPENLPSFPSSVTGII